MNYLTDPTYDLHLEDVKRIDANRLKNRKNKPVYFTRDEELELYIRYKKGDEQAGEDLMLSQLKLVIKISNQFKKSKIPPQFHSDIIGAGYTGLINALKSFNPEKGTFSTWVRKCVTTTIILYEKSLNKFASKVDGHVISGNKIIGTLLTDGAETELFDLIEDDSINQTEEQEQHTKIIKDILADLPLRDREICEYFFFLNKKKKDLPYLLTPLYENEWANIYKYGNNTLQVSFKNENGVKFDYKLDILVFTSNKGENTEILEDTVNISWLSHRHRLNHKKFEHETFNIKLNNVNLDTINLKLNGKNVNFNIQNNILTANLNYKVGYICSDINSRLEKTLDRLRTNPSIIALMDI